MAKQKRSKQDADQWLERYWNSHPFQGEVPFELTIQMLGKTVTRDAKIVFARTPQWPFFDPQTKVAKQAVESGVYHLEVAAVPETCHEDGAITPGVPRWVRLGDITQDDVLPIEFLNEFMNAIDAWCEAEDAKRRAAADM